MRRLSRLSRPARQRGLALVAVMILLFTFSLAVIGSSQQLLVEAHIGRNQDDARDADELAQLTIEVALRETRSLDAQLGPLTPAQLYGNDDSNGVFTAACHNPNAAPALRRGLCLAPVHARQQLADVPTRTVGTAALLSPCGNALEYRLDSSATTDCPHQRILGGRTLWANPRYTIELLDPDYPGGALPAGRLYRVSARAWGRDQHSEATLQHYFVVPGPIQLLDPLLAEP